MVAPLTYIARPPPTARFEICPGALCAQGLSFFFVPVKIMVKYGHACFQTYIYAKSPLMVATHYFNFHQASDMKVKIMVKYEHACF